MAHVFADRVKELTETTGESNLILGGAFEGFQPFSSTVGEGNTCNYCVTDNVNWEVGIGTFSTGPDTLSRDSVLASSNAGGKVVWGAGEKEVFVTLPASDITTLFDHIASVGNIVIDNFIEGVDYTGGTTTALTLTADGGSENNITVLFDGVIQHHTEYSVSGTALTFTEAIPTGTLDVEVIVGKTVPAGTPSDGSVTEVKLATDVQTKLNKDEIIYDSGILTSNTDHLDITGLDLDENEHYEFSFQLYNATGSTINFVLFPNNLINDAYRSQATESTGTTLAAATISNSAFALAGNGGNAVGSGEIHFSANGGFYWTSNMITYIGGQIENAMYGGFKDDIFSGPITEIKIDTTVANGIGIGSRFKITRKIS